MNKKLKPNNNKIKTIKHGLKCWSDKLGHVTVPAPTCPICDADCEVIPDEDGGDDVSYIDACNCYNESM